MQIPHQVVRGRFHDTFLLRNLSISVIWRISTLYDGSRVEFRAINRIYRWKPSLWPTLALDFALGCGDVIAWIRVSYLKSLRDVPANWRQNLKCTNCELVQNVGRVVCSSKFGIIIPRVLVMNDDIDQPTLWKPLGPSRLGATRAPERSVSKEKTVYSLAKVHREGRLSKLRTACITQPDRV